MWIDLRLWIIHKLVLTSAFKRTLAYRFHRKLPFLRVIKLINQEVKSKVIFALFSKRLKNLIFRFRIHRSNFGPIPFKSIFNIAPAARTERYEFSPENVLQVFSLSGPGTTLLEVSHLRVLTIDFVLNESISGSTLKRHFIVLSKITRKIENKRKQAAANVKPFRVFHFQFYLRGSKTPLIILTLKPARA